MARHINQGLPIPVFFYGRPYLGRLNPLFAAGAFRLFGESVLSLRLPQPVLSVAITAAIIVLALRLTRNNRIALMAGLLLAIPPVNMLLYTMTSLGGHAEILLIGILTLLVGYDIYRPTYHIAVALVRSGRTDRAGLVDVQPDRGFCAACRHFSAAPLAAVVVADDRLNGRGLPDFQRALVDL